MPQALKGSDLANLLCSMTPCILLPSTRQLLKCLEDEEITSLVGLRDSLRTEDDIEKFVNASELCSHQSKLLHDAIEVCRKSAALLTTEVLQGARKRVISHRAISACDVDFEASQKFRRIEAKAQRLILGTVHTSVSPLSLDSEAANGPASLRDIRATKKARVIAKCRKLFDRIGIASPRYIRVMETLDATARQSLLDTMDDCYFSNVGIDTVGGYCTYTEAFLTWLGPICHLSDVTAFEVCAYLRDLRTRGTNVPCRHRYALVWAEECFRISLFTGDRAVRALSYTTRGESREPPAKAKCPSVTLVKKIEEACVDKSNPVVVRIICGLMAVLTHGVLRWSDFQRSVKFFLGKDLLTAKSTMKRRDILIPWVAARRGFSGTDWADAFITDLDNCGMPGSDFVLLEPKSLDSFGMKPASYSSIILYIRTSLIHIGVSPREAISFSVHGFRQLYPTLSNQLGMPVLEQEAIGHWKKGSAMPQHYDASTNSLEIRAKQQVLNALNHGYDVAMPGDFLMDIPTKSSSPSTSSSSCSSSLNTPLGDEEMTSTLRRDVPLEVEYVEVPPLKELCSVRPIQVVNTESKKIHLHSPGSMATLCKWTCGSPKNPHFRASFKESYNDIDLTQNVRFVCSRCYSRANCKRLEHLVHIEPYPVLRTLYSDDAPIVPVGTSESHSSQAQEKLSDSGSSSSAESDCSSGCDSSGSSSDS